MYIYLGLCFGITMVEGWELVFCTGEQEQRTGNFVQKKNRFLESTWMGDRLGRSVDGGILIHSVALKRAYYFVAHISSSLSLLALMVYQLFAWWLFF